VRDLSNFPFKTLELSQDFEKRKFSAFLDHEELSWHRDKENRTIEVIFGSGWFLQLDDQKPVLISVGSSQFIPSGTWHRLLKLPNATDLIICIFKQRVNGAT
jgi:quercetin dioxygenase-like cupin family protein